MRTKLTIAAALALTLFSGTGHVATAHTRVGGNADINAIRPAIDSRGYSTVNPTHEIAH